ncbi:ANTAR domain-containing protein [Geodermatophilus sp. SYSU D01176]
MTTGTPTPGHDVSAAPVPRDPGLRHGDAVRSLSAEVDRLQRNLDSVREHSENLQAALESNRRIGMAIGILMVTRRLTDEAALECLRHASNTRNRKLREVAEEVIYQGTLD